MKWLEEQRDPNHPHICAIERVVDETPTVRTLYFHDPVLAKVLPGQFAMVWIPGVNELPMSVMISENDEKAGFTVRKRGESSTALYNLQVGQQIGVRGPYGNSFDIKDGDILLIGGGTGLVPLMRLIKFSKDTNKITLLMGSQTKEEVFFGFIELIEEHMAGYQDPRVNVIPVTEDGSHGEKGYVTDVLEKLLEENKYDAIYTCGPELMMYKVVKLANEKGIFVQASLERMMKCGIGICGSCCVNEDLVCRDGTVFDGQYLAKNNEFGHFQRTKSGILEEI